MPRGLLGLPSVKRYIKSCRYLLNKSNKHKHKHKQTTNLQQRTITKLKQLSS